MSGLSPFSMRQQIYLGEERFVEALQTKQADGRDLTEIPAGSRIKGSENLKTEQVFNTL